MIINALMMIIAIMNLKSVSLFGSEVGIVSSDSFASNGVDVFSPPTFRDSMDYLRRIVLGNRNRFFSRGTYDGGLIIGYCRFRRDSEENYVMSGATISSGIFPSCSIRNGLFIPFFTGQIYLLKSNDIGLLGNKIFPSGALSIKACASLCYCQVP